MEQDPEIALKYGNMLQTEGFQVIESKKRRVHYGKRCSANNIWFIASNICVYSKRRQTEPGVCICYIEHVRAKELADCTSTWLRPGRL